MKAFERLAIEHAKAQIGESAPDIEFAYEQGFKKAREHAASLIETMGVNELAWEAGRAVNLARLIRAIGQADTELQE